MRRRLGSRCVVAAVADRVGRDASLPLTLTSHDDVSGTLLNFARASLLRCPGIKIE